MKKLYSLLLVLIMVVGLGACSPSNTYDDTEVKNELVRIEDKLDLSHEELETLIANLETRIDNLTVVEGLNGQKSIYENQREELYVSNKVGYLMYLDATLQQLGDELDKTKTPDYVLDVDGEYINFSSLASLLGAKYFDAGAGMAINLHQVRLKYSNNVLSGEEVLARMVLLYEELSNYSFYTIGCTAINLTVDYYVDGEVKQISFTIGSNVFNSGFVSMSPTIIIDKYYDNIYSSNHIIDKALAQSYYDDYVLNETYSGYVLDYK